MTKRLSAVVLALAIAVSLHAVLPAQQPPNYNVNSSIPDPLNPLGAQYVADPYRQRTVEPTVAVSPLNSDVLMAASNNYSVVDMDADPTVGAGEGSQLARLFGLFSKAPLAAAKEAWIGVYFSYDRGRHWINMLHPGHPADRSPLGTSLPIFGRTAASDPVLTAAPGSAHFYLGGMYFDRGGFSQVAVSRYTHLNNEGKHSIVQDYDRVRVIDSGAAVALQFADKGFITADTPRDGKPFGKVFFTYSVFTGMGGVDQFQSQIRFSVSEDGGNTWSKAKKVNGTLIRNQGSYVAFHPDTGRGYIFWRTFNPHRIMWVMASDSKNVSNPALAVNICPYDAPTQSPPVPDLARTLAFPSAVFDNQNRVHVVWQGRELVNGACTSQGMPRIFMTTGTVHPVTGNITSWTTPTRIEDPPSPRWEKVIEGEGPTEVAPNTPGATQRPAGPQFKPTIAHSGGNLLVLYKESRGDALDTNGFPSGIARRVDVRAARIDVRSTPFIGTTRQIATYDIDSLNGNIIQSNPSSAPGTKEAVHFENLRMYQGGNAAFGGDYEFVTAAQSFVTGSPWHWATDAEVPSPSFFAVWYDTRTVKFPFGSINGDWTKFTNPGLTANPNDPDAGCNPGSRNSSIYFAEIDAGVVVSSPQTFKEMGTANGQVTYAVTIRNPKMENRQFKLTLQSADGVNASWDQFNPDVDVMGQGPGLDPTTGKCLPGSYPTCTERLALLPRSSATLTVFATGPDPSPANAIKVVVDDPNTLQQPDAILRLNPQDQTSVPTSADAETHTPGIGTPGIGTPGIGTPGIGTVGPAGAPGIGTPGIGTPGIGTPGIGTSAPDDWGSYTQVVFPVSNTQLGANINTTSAFNTFINLANEEEIASEHLLQLIIVEPGKTPTTDGCNAGEVIYDQLISSIPGTPGIGTPGIGTPGIGTPGIGTPGIGTSTVSNATFSLAPTASVGGSHQEDGAVHSLRGPDTKLVVVRAWHCHNPSGCQAGGQTFRQETGPESFPDTPAEVESGLVLTVVGANPTLGGVPQPTPTVVTSKAPDLVITTTPTVSPTSVAAGGTVQFPVGGWTLQNAPTATAPAKAPFSHGYYLSADATIDPSTDTLLGTEVTTTDLAVGATQSFAKRTLTIPLGTAPGDYFIGIFVDRSNAVAELNEGNNSAAVDLEVMEPADTIPGSEIIVSDNSSLHRFSPTGTFLGTIATLEGCFQPHGTVIGPGGDFFVAAPCPDPDTTGRVYKITPGGVVTEIYPGTLQSQPMQAPIAIAMDVNGDLIVGDNNVDKLFKLAPNGSSIIEFAALPGPSPCCLQDLDIKRDKFGNLVVAYDSFGNSTDVGTSGAIFRFAPDGTPTPVVNGTGAFSVGGLAIKPDGNYVIADFNQRRVVQVTPKGSMTPLITDETDLCCNLVGMAIDSGGSFISTLNFSNKLLKITPPETVTTLAQGEPIAGPNYVVIYPVARNLILNGDFEQNSADGCSSNLTNAQFNAIMNDATAFGTAEEIDVYPGTCDFQGSAPQSGTTKIAIHTRSQTEGGLYDAFSFNLANPLVAGQTYLLEFYAESVTEFDPDVAAVEVGLSSSATDFGQLLFSSGLPTPGGWTKFSHTFVAPSGASYLTVRNVLDKEVWNHIDNFRLFLVQAPEP